MDELKHYGIPNQKWGLRRFQNEDGSLTSAGRLRYGKITAERNALRKAERNSSKTVDTKPSSAKPRKMSKTDEASLKAEKNRLQTLKDIKTLQSELDPEKANLKAEKDRLQTLKDIRTLQAELNPEKTSRVDRFVKEFSDNLVTNMAKMTSQQVTNIASNWIKKKLRK